MLKIRLRRMGATHRPFYRVVASDQRKFPTATAVEELGFYDPKTKPATVSIDAERVQYWVDRGAQMSPTVERLLKRNTREAPAAVEEAEAPAAAEAAEETAEATSAEA